jgi:hypothetical protein
MKKEVLPVEKLPAKRPLANYQFSDICYDYLEKMTQLCKEKGVELVLVKAPSLYPYWYEEYSSQIAQFAVVDDPSSIDAIETAPQLSADGMVLTVMSMEPIQVFSMQGVAQQVAITTTDEAQLVNLATLPTGSYVIRCGEQSFTLYKK